MHKKQQHRKQKILQVIFFLFCFAAGSRDTRLRGWPRLSRCTAGQLRRWTTPWTVSELRTPTPPAWVMRSTYLDRWAQLNTEAHQADKNKCKVVVFFPLPSIQFFVLICLQTRDWNEELQTTRELPRKNLPERLLRERAIFKVLPPGLCVPLCDSGCSNLIF